MALFCLVSCRDDNVPSPAASAEEETFETHVDELVGLVSEFVDLCGEIDGAASFDKNLPKLEGIVEQIGSHGAKWGKMEELTNSQKKEMREVVEKGFKNMGEHMKSIRKLTEITDRKDEVAALLEEVDSAIFANFVLYGRLTLDLDDYGGKLSTPVAAHIDVSNQALNQLNASTRKTLFRYLAGNPRWEIRQERGKVYAVRLEPEENYKPTLNGFVSANGRQTRVIIAFEENYGFGHERGNITRAKAGVNDVAVVVEAPHSGTPGHSSYTIIEGGGVFLEMYDQSPDVVRKFTQKTYNDISNEISEVLKHRAVIDDSGVMPVSKYYPVSLPDGSKFEVKDAFQPGIFAVEASVSVTEKGCCYIRAFNVASGERLSEQRITPRSTRYVGWDRAGKRFFPYSSEVTVYEGNWTTKYKARFELWHKTEDGSEKKLGEIERMINGWQR